MAGCSDRSVLDDLRAGRDCDCQGRKRVDLGRTIFTYGAGQYLLTFEPYAEDRLEANFNPVGRAYFSASTLLCTPCSLSQEGGLALGAQAGEARLRAVVTNSGFGLFRRAAQTPFNLIFEARV